MKRVHAVSVEYLSFLRVDQQTCVKMESDVFIYRLLQFTIAL
jgi:hypothetical protein